MCVYKGINYVYLCVHDSAVETETCLCNNSRIRSLRYVPPELNTSFEFKCILSWSVCLVEIWKYDRIAISALGYRYITLKSHKTETVYSSWSFRVPVKVGNLNGPLLNLCVHFGSERSAVAYFCSRFSNVAAGENKKCEIKYYVYPTMRTSREILYGL